MSAVTVRPSKHISEMIVNFWHSANFYGQDESTHDPYLSHTLIDKTDPR